MGKLKAILLGTFLFAASVPTFAGWRIVIDRNCIATVGANTVSYTHLTLPTICSV